MSQTCSGGCIYVGKLMWGSGPFIWMMAGLLPREIFFLSLDYLNWLYIVIGFIIPLASPSPDFVFIRAAYDISATYFCPRGLWPGWCLKALISTYSSCFWSYLWYSNKVAQLRLECDSIYVERVLFLGRPYHLTSRLGCFRKRECTIKYYTWTSGMNWSLLGE